jgi:hypothetical protein
VTGRRWRQSAASHETCCLGHGCCCQRMHLAQIHAGLEVGRLGSGGAGPRWAGVAPGPRRQPSHRSAPPSFLPSHFRLQDHPVAAGAQPARPQPKGTGCTRPLRLCTRHAGGPEGERAPPAIHSRQSAHSPGPASRRVSACLNALAHITHQHASIQSCRAALRRLPAVDQSGAGCCRRPTGE